MLLDKTSHKKIYKYSPLQILVYPKLVRPVRVAQIAIAPYRIFNFAQHLV